MMTPRKLKPWLIAVAVGYLLLPRDLIPDFAGRGLGLIDDLVLIAGAIWLYRKQRRDFEQGARGAAGRAEAGQERRGPSRGPAESPPGEAAADPHAVLGVPRSASQEVIRDAYRARMREYHPDKVSHLGEELQQVAHRKALEIQRAFEALRK